LKRKNQEADDDEDDQPRKKRKKNKKPKGDEDAFSHAEKAGKKYMANYCAFAHKEDIFEGFAEAAKATGEMNDDKEQDDDGDECADGEFEDEMSGAANDPVNAVADYDLTKTEDWERFARDSAIRFFNDAHPKEVRGWEKEEYQSSVRLISKLSRSLRESLLVHTRYE
jgi:hypothetical protein